jgi:predicted nucleotidyltransferase
MNTYRIDFRKLRQDPSLSQMLGALERGFKQFEIDFYLVGAVARDIHIGYHKLPAKRATDDIDFAVLIRDEKKYKELREYLIGKEGFSAYKDNPLVLLWHNGKEVDLMPFNDVSDKGSISIASVGLTDLSVDGFKEVYESNLPEVELADNHRFKFCSLPGIVLLKLIAWSDRPEWRESDITDISYIIEHFYAIHEEEIWDNHNDLFPEDDHGDYKDIELAAQVLGRKIGAIAKPNEKIVNRLRHILSKTQDRIAIIMTSYFDSTIEENKRILERLLKGIEETATR